MERRSWLWRRKSTEKSPGETESSGGSISSHSERFSDEQVYLNQSSQSPEPTSKAEQCPKELDGDVKTLSEKLSAALLNISAKEDLVKQHAKVAEEAVEGWERAENEVFALRQQVEVLTLRNSTLEDQVGHLDGALKECLRQLRQTREEKEQNVQDSTEWQLTKSELMHQIANLNSQLQAAKTETSLTSIDTNQCSKLEMAEKENSALKMEISSMAEELEIRLIERELSNQAAEQASKLHLESIKKAAKFEAECRRLTSTLRKATNEHKSFTDSQSDTWERLSLVESDALKETNEFGSSRTTPSIDINLMDDFLEMERLAAIPESDRSLGGSVTKTNSDVDMYVKAELEAMMNRTSEVEEMLKKVETEKVKLESTLKDRENELKVSRNRLQHAQSKLVEMGTRLMSANEAREMREKELESSKESVKALQERVKRGEMEVGEVQSQLDKADSRLEATYTKKEEAESRCKVLETELEALLSKVKSLETEVQMERTSTGMMGAKCRELEGEISRLQIENQYPKVAKRNAELRIKQDMELAMAGSKFVECQKTIASLNKQLKTLATLEEWIQ